MLLLILILHRCQISSGNIYCYTSWSSVSGWPLGPAGPDRPGEPGCLLCPRDPGLPGCLGVFGDPMFWPFRLELPSEPCTSKYPVAVLHTFRSILLVTYLTLFPENGMVVSTCHLFRIIHAFSCRISYLPMFVSESYLGCHPRKSYYNSLCVSIINKNVLALYRLRPCVPHFCSGRYLRTKQICQRKHVILEKFYPHAYRYVAPSNCNLPAPKTGCS